MIPLRQSQAFVKLAPPCHYAQRVAPTAVLTALDVGVVVEDADGRVIASNPAADRLLGPEPSTIHEDGWPLPPENRPGAVALRTGEECGATVGLHAADGVTWVEVSAYP